MGAPTVCRCPISRAFAVGNLHGSVRLFSTDHFVLILEKIHFLRYYAYQNPRSIWDAPNAISHICQGLPGQPECPGTDFTTHVDLKDADIMTDAGTIDGKNCNLKAVSWVIPDGNYSDHPQGGPGGPNWVADIVDAVGQSGCTDTLKGKTYSYWQDTAILITWDDWGGFYDHVPPYRVVPNNGSWGAGYVAGFRVPLLVVSAYTGTSTAGYISGPCQSSGNCQNNKAPYQHDFGSILNFIEYAFGLPQGGISPNLNWSYDDFWAPDYYFNGSCQGNQHLCPYGLSDFFNFSQAPRPFKRIEPITYQPSDFVNLSGFGGVSLPPDTETE
jgi:Phosphoesterase family